MENILKIVAVAIGILAAAGLVFKVAVKYNRNNTTTKQSKNVVGGDQAGRDIKK